MTALPNPLRGEAPLKIGDVDLVVAIEFGSLARFSRALGSDSMDEVFRRLLGFEPFAAALALRCFTIHANGKEEAEKLAVAAIGKLSAADEASWRAAFEEAIAAHIDGGRALRSEPSLAEEAGVALARAGKKKVKSPS
jgi:hypothetical protein